VTAIARYLVDDLDAAVRFYVDRLGFTQTRSFGPVTLVERNGQEVWLSGPGSSGREQEAAAPGGWNRIVLEVPDLDEAIDGLATRGPRVDGPAGSWHLVEDPSGNPIELFQPK
jgi:catechol 2,3-dioxygenase-like lactoylglutathione lyase family enzyme